MKKVFAVLLALAMLLGSVSALAEEKTGIVIDDTLSIAVVLPVGYKLDSAADGGVMVALAEPADGSEDKVSYLLLIAPDEEYPTLERLNDLSQEELDAYGLSCVEDLYQPTISLAETEVGTYLFVIDENDSEYDVVEILCIYKGYDIVLYLDYPDGRTVTEADIAAGVKFFSDMDFNLTV